MRYEHDKAREENIINEAATKIANGLIYSFIFVVVIIVVIGLLAIIKP